MNNTAAVASVIDNLVAGTLSYALLLAAIGTLSMAFIELIKSVASVRRHFHRNQFNKWMTDQKCRNETLVIATGGKQYENVLFDQPIDRMLGQIQAAANLALEFPDRYPRAYDFFTQEDLEIKRLNVAAKTPPDSQVWADFATSVGRTGFTRSKAKRGQQTDENAARAAQQARVRLGNLVARRLDAFQNRTQYLWARGNQTAAVVTGAALTAYALTRTATVSGIDNIVVLLSLSFLAGMLAPFAKDVVSAISGIRTKA